MSFESEEWNGQVGDDDARVYSAIGVLGNGATDKERGGREREREREAKGRLSEQMLLAQKTHVPTRTCF